jgi:DNA polymerase-1
LKSSSPSPDRSIYVIDASSFIFRAYYALAPLSSRGRPSHAVAGFINTLMKLLREKNPKACVVVFDSKRPSFRKDFYAAYKANRVAPPPDISEQITAVREMCEKARLPTLQEEGFEADDWIASFVKQYRTTDRIVIVSTDKDLMALIDSRVSLYDAFKEREIGADYVFEKWGILPEQVTDFLSLTGDSSDNIPGLPGVGPKTAASWLRDHKTIDTLLEKMDSFPEKVQSKFRENAEMLEVSRKLVKLREDLPLPFKALEPLAFPLPPELRAFLLDWDCTKTLEQFAAELGTSGLSSAGMSKGAPAEFHLAKSVSDLELIETEIRKFGEFIFDIESDSFERLAAKMVGISIAWDTKTAWYIAIRHEEKPISENDVRTFLKRIFEDPNIRKIAHNLKYDLEILSHDGIEVSGEVADTMVEGHLLHADRRSFSLANLAREFLGEEKGDLQKLLDKGEDFSKVDLQAATQYAAQDAHLTAGLHEKFSGDLAKLKEIQWLYREVEMPLVQVLCQMERSGILLNVNYLKKLSKDLHHAINGLQLQIYSIAECEFNIQSPKQLQDILFTRLKLTPTKKTKTGFSTDESVLEDLCAVHELPRLLLKYRGLCKLTSTYVDVLPELIASDGRIHTHYHQTGTATGRLSSSDPNLQNIPIRSEEGAKIREAFEAPPGFLLLSADYSQVELRLFAHMSGDENLIRAFQAERDIHSETAKVMFGNGDGVFREKAKAINYGIIYGISAFGLAKQLGITRSEAAQFMETYFSSFPRLREYMTELTALTKKSGYTATLFGRRRPLPDIHSTNPTLRQMAERISINAPVQGTAADIMKSAMVRIYRRLKGDGVNSRLLLQVHDELVLEVQESEMQSVSRMVTEEMGDLSSTPLKNLRVPLVVDVSLGKNWGQMK